MKKGVAYSTIVILALVGVLLVSVWSFSQLATGTRFGATITQRQKEDISISNLELAKQFMTQNLKFSSSSASVDIAANGGTQVPKTYWYCGDEATPPELNEVQFALSNTTRSYLGAYISTLSESELKNLGVSVSPYSCVGITDPGSDNCLKKDTSNCESFTSSATQGGLIEVSTPAYVSYSGDLAADVATDRFFNFYYKLYKDTKESGLTRSIAQGLRDSCPMRTNSDQRLKFALQKACDHYEALFEEPDGKKYVKCEYELLCTDTVNPTACTNVNCKRPPLAQQLCWESASTSKVNVDLSYLSGFNKIFDSFGGKIVKAQGTFAGIEIIFHLTDTKYKVSSARGPVDLVWNLYAAIEVDNQQCRPIN